MYIIPDTMCCIYAYVCSIITNSKTIHLHALMDRYGEFFCFRLLWRRPTLPYRAYIVFNVQIVMEISAFIYVFFIRFKRDELIVQRYNDGINTRQC